MYAISRLAKLFGLSRSTLLYYDRIGILKPTGRTCANYREYSEDDRQRLEQICLYRKCGLPLKDIGRLMDGGGSPSAAILEKHLAALNRRIADLRHQQHVILKLLKNDMLPQASDLTSSMMDVKKWTDLLRAAGLDDDGMHQWHIEFEKLSPDGHHDFLKSLGLSEEDVLEIREGAGKG